MRQGSWIDLRRSSTTFRDLTESWIALNPQKRQRSLDRDLGILKLHLLPALGTRQIHTIKKTDIQALINTWVASGLKPGTIRRHHAVLKAIFNHAINDERLNKNPALRVNVPSTDRIERHPLTPEEANRLLESIDPFYKPLIYIAITTGLRWSELAGLQICDVVLEGPEPQLTVNRGRHSTSKGAKYEKPKSLAGHRTLPLGPKQVALINSHLGETSPHRTIDSTEPVFMTQNGRYLNYRNFRDRYFNPALSRAGLSNVRFHDLRRTTATLMVANQIDLKTIEAWMGHSDVRLTLGLYASPIKSGSTAALRMLEEVFPKEQL
jgi:integrase